MHRDRLSWELHHHWVIFHHLSLAGLQILQVHSGELAWRFHPSSMLCNNDLPNDYALGTSSGPRVVARESAQRWSLS